MKGISPNYLLHLLHSGLPRKNKKQEEELHASSAEARRIKKV
jgi:hypothetical protein